MTTRCIALLTLVLSCSCDDSPEKIPPASNKNAQEENRAEETIEIPLNTVWAYDMPHTRDIRRLQPYFFTEAYANSPPGERLRLSRESDIRGIQKELDDRPADGPKDGFAVQASGTQALSEMLAILSEKNPARKEFLTGSDVSLIFFSYQTGVCVNLQSIEREGKTFVIKYIFVPHMQADVSEHFAIIPAGDLEAGEYHVEFQPVIEKDQTVDLSYRIACQDFEFRVSDQPKE